MVTPMTPLNIGDEEIGEPFEWDGHSPINGEPVTRTVKFHQWLYIFTATSVYRAPLKPAAPDQEIA